MSGSQDYSQTLVHLLNRIGITVFPNYREPGPQEHAILLASSAALPLRPQPLWKRVVGYLLIVTLTALQLQPALYAAPIADPTGNIGFAPNIQVSGTGVPVINITAPNAHGVSLNTYGQFDVDAIGVILNNSLTGGGSLLGGQISANPNFNGRAAGVVVNEVIGASRSQLQGGIELFGAPAWVVIVNPNGIHCDGCGTTNIPQLTLSTGALDWRDAAGRPALFGDASAFAFDVRSGDITIGAAGVEGTRSQIDLVAPRILVNGAVRGGEQLNVIAGQQTVDAGNFQTSRVADPSGAPAPFLIDASALGAMTAGSISLMVNGSGAGVRSLAPIAAQQQNLTIQADGSLQLASSFAQGQLDIISRHGGVALDATTGLAAVNIDAEGSVNTRGPLEAGGDLTVTSHTGAVRLAGNTLAVDNLTVSASDIILSGDTASGQQTSLTGERIHIDQTLTAIGGAAIRGDEVDVQAEIATRDGLDIVAQQLTLGSNDSGARITGDLTAVSQDIRADGGLIVTGSASLSSGHDLSIANVITGNNLQLSAQHDLTVGNISSGGAISLDAGHQLALNSGISGDSVYLSAPSLNLANAITAVQNIGFTSDTLNVAGALTAGGTVSANVQNDAVFGGEIYAGNGLAMQTGGLLQFEQNVIAGGRSTLNAGNDLIAQAGFHAMDLNAVAGNNLYFAQDLLSGGAVALQAANDLTIGGDAIATQSLAVDVGNRILFAGAVDAGALNATGQHVRFDGDVNVLRDATVAAGSMVLADRFIAGGSARLSAADGGIESQGQLMANEDLIIESARGIALAESGAGRNAQLTARDGEIAIVHDFSAGNDITITGSDDIAAAALNAGGTLAATAAGRIDVDRIAVNGAVNLTAADTIAINRDVDVGGNAALDSGNDIAIGGALSAAGRLDAHAVNTLSIGSDTGGDAAAADGIALAARDITVGGSLLSNGALSAEAAQSLNVGGNVEILQTLNLVAGENISVGGDTAAAEGAHIVATGSVTLAGDLGSGAAATVAAGQDLSVGNLLVDGDTSLAATAGDLRVGALSTNGEARLVAGNDIEIGGILEVTESAALAAGGNVTTLADVLIGGDYSASLGGNLIHGGGTLILGNAEMTSGGSQAYRGDLLGAHALDVIGNGLVVAGNMVGVNHARVDAGNGNALITGSAYSGDVLDIAAAGDIAIGGFAQGRGIALESREAGVYIADATMSEGTLAVAARDDIFFGNLVGTSGDISGVSSDGSITFNNGLATLADVSLHAHRDLVFDGETSLGGAVDLSADTGTLRNLGSMLLAQPAAIDIGGNFANDGTLIVNGDFALAANDISVNGSLIALGDIAATAQNNITTGSGSVVNAVGDIALAGRQVSSAGTLAAGETLAVTGSFSNNGLAVAADSITVRGGSFANRGTLYAPNVTITGSGGSNSGSLAADNTLSVNVTGGFNNDGQIAAHTVSLTAAGTGNGGSISGNDVTINGGLTNSGTVTGSVVTLAGGAVTNTLTENRRCRPDLEEPCNTDNPAHHIYTQKPAVIAASGALDIRGASLANEGVIQAGNTLSVNVSGAITNTRSANDPYNQNNWDAEEDEQKSPHTGIIVAGSGIVLDGGSITNRGGVIQSGGTLSMVADNAITSSDNGSDEVAPLIIAHNTLSMTGGGISLDGTTLSTGGSATLTANRGSFANQGVIGAAQDLTIAATGNVVNTNALLADGAIGITGQGISNSGIIYQFSPVPEPAEPEEGADENGGGNGEGENANPEPTPSGPNSIALNAGTGMFWNSGDIVARDSVTIRAGAYGATTGASGSHIISYGNLGLTIPGFTGTGALMSTLQAADVLTLNIAGVTVGAHEEWVSGAQTVNLGRLTNYGNVMLTGRLNGNAYNLVTLGADNTAEALPASYIGGGCPQSGAGITCELISYQTIANRGHLIVQGGIDGTLYNEAAAYTAPRYYAPYAPELAVTWRIIDEATGEETFETVIARDDLPANRPFLAVPGSATVELIAPLSGVILGEDLTITGDDIIIAPLDNTHGQEAIAAAQNAEGGVARTPSLGNQQTVSGAIIIGEGNYPGQTVAPIGASGFASLDQAMLAAGLADNDPDARTVQAASGGNFRQNVYDPDFFRMPEPRQPDEGEVKEPWEFPTAWSNPGDLPGGTIAAQQLVIDADTLTNYGNIITFIPRDEEGNPTGDYDGAMAIHAQLFNYGNIYSAGDLDITGSVLNSRPFTYDQNGAIILDTVQTNWGRNTPDYLRNQCRADHGYCITVEERVPGPAAVIGAAGDLTVHGDVTNIGSTIAVGGNIAIDGQLTNESIVLETVWNSHWREWRGHFRGYTDHREHGADYSRVAQGVVSAGQNLETNLNVNTGVIIAGTPPNPDDPEDEGIKGNITIHGGHTGITDTSRPTPVNVKPAAPGEEAVPVMPGTIYATGDVTIDGGEQGRFGNTGAVIAGGTIHFDTDDGPLVLDTGTHTVTLTGEHGQTIFIDGDNWYTASGDQKQPGGIWIAEDYQYNPADLTINCKDCIFQVAGADDNAFMAQLAQELGDAWNFEAVEEHWNVSHYQTRTWRNSGIVRIFLVAVAIVISILCQGTCAPQAFAALIGNVAVASAMYVAAIVSLLGSFVAGRFDLLGFLQNILIAGITAGIMQETGLSNMGYAPVDDVVFVLDRAGGLAEILVATTSGVSDWGSVMLGALGQGAISAAIAELTGGDAGQSFLLAFAMAMARAVAAEIRVNQMHSSTASAVFCEGDICRPNFTIDPITGEVQLGGERINPVDLCSGQAVGSCSVVGFDANGNEHTIFGYDAENQLIRFDESRYPEIVRFEYNGGYIDGGDPSVRIPLEDAINTSGCAPLGCSQSGMQGSFFEIPYDKGDPGVWNRFANTVVEAFSGVHDFLNDYIGFGYGSTGLTARDAGWWSEFMAVVNIPLSAPLAFSNLVTPEMQYWIQNYYDNLEKR